MRAQTVEMRGEAGSEEGSGVGNERETAGGRSPGQWSDFLLVHLFVWWRGNLWYRDYNLGVARESWRNMRGLCERPLFHNCQPLLLPCILFTRSCVSSTLAQFRVLPGETVSV